MGNGTETGSLSRVIFTLESWGITRAWVEGSLPTSWGNRQATTLTLPHEGLATNIPLRRLFPPTAQVREHTMLCLS